MSDRPTPDRAFEPPKSAVDVRKPLAWAFLITVCFLAAVLSFLGRNSPPLLPAPDSLVSVILLAALVALNNRFGTYSTIGGLSVYTTLAGPILFASAIVLDWRHFAATVVLGECFTFTLEAPRRVHPTVWYIRVFDAAELIIAGAGSLALLHHYHALFEGTAGWWSPGAALAFAFAIFVWHAFDLGACTAMQTLAIGARLSSIRISAREFLAEYFVLLLAVPFAKAWHENVWSSLFVLASLGVAYRLLKVPELEYRAATDERSGLANAAAFERALEFALLDAAHRARPLALLAIDIDHFKTVNDRFGHVVGDRVIARFGALLAAELGSHDLAGRVGGEEFAVLVWGDAEAGAALAERMRASVAAEPFAARGVATPLGITASFGVASFPLDALTVGALREAADAALYAAKRGGRNTVRVFTTANDGSAYIAKGE